MVPYLDCTKPDQSRITLEIFENINEIPYMEPAHVVNLHQHQFYEMVLILRGSCQHYYKNMSIPLIPGDLFLIPPDQPHSYRFSENISLCNCQFFLDVLESTPYQFVSDIEYTALQQENFFRKRLKDMRAFRKTGEKIADWHSGDINSQGIIHLNSSEREFIETQFRNMLAEQNEQKFGFERIKQTLLEQVLIHIKRVQTNQFAHKDKDASWKEEMIDSVLNMIETNVAYKFDFHTIAQTQNITITYFRSIFKNITGLSPVEYLNRVRMLKALELLQATSLSIAEISERVGIYDTNYFFQTIQAVHRVSAELFQINSIRIISTTNPHDFT